MDLCLAIGCTLGELPSRMTSQEFGLWFHRWQTEPWGDRRADVHVGLLRSTIAQWSGRTLKEGAHLSLDAFIPFRARTGPELPEVDPMTHFRALGG